MKRFFLWLRQNPHVWWSLLLFYLLALYFLAENCVTGDYHATQTAIDTYIPFFAPAVVAYLLWFPLLVGTGLWLMAKDGRGFRNYMWFLAVCFTISAAVYFLWPSGQDLRPDLSAPKGIFERVLSRIYAFDTNTNVFPSLHVSCSVGAALALWDSPTTKKNGIRPAAAALAVLIIASTVLVKQHAFMDIPGGFAAALLSRGAVKLINHTIKEKALRD